MSNLQLDAARARARALIDGLGEPDPTLAAIGVHYLTPPEAAIETCVEGDGLIFELFAWRLLPGPGGSSHRHIGLAHLAALDPHRRRALITAALGGMELIAPEARRWLHQPGVEGDRRYPRHPLSGEFPVLPGATAHPNQERARRLVDRIGSAEPDEDRDRWPLLPVEHAVLALTRRERNRRELLFDLVAARLALADTDGSGPAPGMAGSVLALARLLSLDPGALAREIEDGFRDLALTAGMARACLLLGGVEAVRRDPDGVARLVGGYLDEDGARTGAPVEDLDRRAGTVTAHSFNGEVLFSSHWTDDAGPEWMALRSRRLASAGPGDGDRPRWRLPIELARPLGHRPGPPFDRPASLDDPSPVDDLG